MTSSDRQFTWRQGDVLPDDTAVSLGIYPAEESGASFAIVVSHDCDLTATVAQKEVFKQWRLEHMSLQDDPPQPMLTCSSRDLI